MGSPRLEVLKFGTSGMVESNASAEGGQGSGVFGNTGAIEPPADPMRLAVWFENSNALRQNVAAYETNIDGFGYRFEPEIDLESDGADKAIADAIYIERIYDAEMSGESLSDVPEPTAQEVAERKALVAKEMRIEALRLRARFEFLSRDCSFTALRRRTRMDLETTGNAYWEVIRNNLGEIVQIKHVNASTMRLRKMGGAIKAVDRIDVSPIAYREVPVKKRFRSYVQIADGRRVFFKEIGDPRVMGAVTGRYYAGSKVDSGDRPATEILHFAIYAPRGGGYGLPRWLGNLLSVLGSRQSEEANYLYFDNKTIPSMFVMVEGGGRLTDAALNQLRNVFEKEIKGVKNFHKCIVLQAEPFESGGGNSADGRMKIKVQPMTQEQVKDALFMGYDERNRDKIGESFRLPRLLRGDVRDFNRATADAALKFAESQVFSPERVEFDFIVGRKILMDMGIKYHRFVSNGPPVGDSDALAETIVKMEKVLTREEAREFAGGVFGRPLRRIDEEWTKKPVDLTAGAADGSGASQEPDEGDEKGEVDARESVTRSALSDAAHLIRIRDALAAAEGAAAQSRFKLSKDEEGNDVITVPSSVMDGWFEPK